jgi:hypothetical protein
MWNSIGESSYADASATNLRTRDKQCAVKICGGAQLGSAESSP